jgi:UTP--glucose-1-phosphate uridylyltransferase
MAFEPGPDCGGRQRRPVGHAILLAREVLADESFAVIIPNLLVLGQQSCLRQMVNASKMAAC